MCLIAIRQKWVCYGIAYTLNRNDETVKHLHFAISMTFEHNGNGKWRFGAWINAKYSRYDGIHDDGTREMACELRMHDGKTTTEFSHLVRRAKFLINFICMRASKNESNKWWVTASCCYSIAAEASYRMYSICCTNIGFRRLRSQ